MKLSSAVIVFVLGAGAGIGLTRFGTHRQIAHLKHVSDSTKAVSVARDSIVTAFGDSLVHVIDSIQTSKRPTTIRIVRDSAAQDSLKHALAAGLKSQHDTIANQALQITSLESQVAGLKTNAAKDSLSLWKAMWRGDSLQAVVHTQTKTIGDLNRDIQRLDHHTLPGWARTTLTIARTGLATKGLIDVVRGK